MFKIYISLLFFTMYGDIYAYEHVPSRVMSAYDNKIIAEDFSFDQDNASLIIQLQFKKTPICFYYPESYQDNENDMIKRFFIPRTDWHHKKMKEFMQKIDVVCNQLNITCECNHRVGSHFGLEMIFRVNSFYFDIKKVIDEKNNIVIFQINLKK